MIAIPVPLLLIVGSSWGWIVAANVVLGVSQGLTWSTTVMMKMDLVGPARRGLAMGLNEAAGYLGVAATALATGYIASTYGLRPGPFLLGAAFIAAGLGLSVLTVRETHHHATAEAANHVSAHAGAYAQLSNREVFTLTSFRDKSLSSVSQAGLVNNLNDGLAWGLFPILFAAAGLSIERIGILAAVYPAVWGAGQLVTGALSDRIGRKPLIVAGMLVQAAALAMVAVGHDFGTWLTAAVLLGAGTALVYPTLIAAVSDAVTPVARAPVVGVYRFWRDSGYVFGGLIAGGVADTLGYSGAITLVAVITAASGLWVLYDMPQHPRSPAAAPTRADRPRPDVTHAAAPARRPVT